MSWLKKAQKNSPKPDEIQQELKKWEKPSGDCFRIAGKTAIEVEGTLVHGTVAYELLKG